MFAAQPEPSVGALPSLASGLELARAPRFGNRHAERMRSAACPSSRWRSLSRESVRQTARERCRVAHERSDHDAALHQVADDLQVHRRSTYCPAALAVTEQSVAGHDPGDIARGEIAVVVVEAIRVLERHFDL